MLLMAVLLELMCLVCGMHHLIPTNDVVSNDRNGICGWRTCGVAVPMVRPSGMTLAAATDLALL